MRISLGSLCSRLRLVLAFFSGLVRRVAGGVNVVYVRGAILMI
jgi:hypothetical protein